MAAVTVSFGQTTLYYDRDAHPGWFAPDAWSTTGVAGPFDTDWIDGSIAHFGPGAGFNTDPTDPTLEGQTLLLGGLVNTGGRITLRRPGPFGTDSFTLDMQVNAAIDGDFDWELIEVVNDFTIVGGQVRIVRTITPIVSTVTLAGGDYEIVLGGGGSSFDADFVINSGNFDINHRALVEVGSISMDGGAVRVGHHNGFQGSQVVVQDFSGTSGLLEARDGGSNGGGDVNTFTIDQDVHTEFAGDIIGFAPGTSNTLEMVKTGSGNLTLSGTIHELPLLTVQGTGTLTLSGASNTQTGDTIIESGVLEAAHSSALGSSQVRITGTGDATLRIVEGEEIGNDILFSNTNPGSGVEHTLALGETFKTGTTGEFRSDFADGRRTTTVEFLGGEAAAERTLQMSFGTISTASNDSLRFSDIFILSGTDGDEFVLQLGLTEILPSEDGSFLGWFDGDKWVNAIEGNSAIGADAVLGFQGSFADSEALANPDYLGSYGLDLDNNVVWAILDHNSQFAVIPEPSNLVLLLAAGIFGLTARHFYRLRIS